MVIPCVNGDVLSLRVYKWKGLVIPCGANGKISLFRVGKRKGLVIPCGGNGKVW